MGPALGRGYLILNSVRVNYLHLWNRRFNRTHWVFHIWICIIYYIGEVLRVIVLASFITLAVLVV